MKKIIIDLSHRTKVISSTTLILCLCGLAMALMTVSCASSRSANVYSRDQARQTQTVATGVVNQVRPVTIEGTKSPAGTIAGGAVGGVAGSAVGGGTGRNLATVVGSIAGAVAGSAVEEGLTRKDGLEITVTLDSGALIAVVQEADENFAVGERVRVLTSSDGTTRVTH